MGNYDEIRRRDDEIRDKYYQELRKTHEALNKDLNRKLRRLYIGGFIIFVLMCILYAYLSK